VSRPVGTAVRTVGRIPVRNLWLLFLYASDLARWDDRFDMAPEEDDADLPTLVARLLANAVDERIRRNLSRSYVPRAAVLSRVRGRIDMLATEATDLLSRGLVACRFEELSTDTVRNRLIRAALQSIAPRAEPDVGHRCRSLAAQLGSMGVTGPTPSRAEIAGNVMGRNDAADRLVVALARLALELALPTEDEGAVAGRSPVRDAVAARRLFERAVGGFYRTELTPDTGWTVRTGTHLQWPIEQPTGGLAEILPGMITDVVLTHRTSGRRIVIDTKFNGILAPGRWGGRTVRSGYMFQMYAYLRSQTGRDDALAERAEGLLLHPSIDEEVHESALFQGHRIGFATVDLSGETASIRRRLLEIIAEPASTSAIDPANSR
jgi:5-methylcytosine-specific restriction enzyme subunit McrC